MLLKISCGIAGYPPLFHIRHSFILQIINFSTFFSVVTYCTYNYGSILRGNSTRTPPILMNEISFSFSNLVWMNALGVYITVTYLSYSASMIQYNIIYLVTTVGKLESSFKIKYICLFPYATVLPLIVPYIFT